MLLVVGSVRGVIMLGLALFVFVGSVVGVVGAMGFNVGVAE